MKLATVLYQGKEQPAVLLADASYALFSDLGVAATSLMELVRSASAADMDTLRKASAGTNGIPASDVALLAPLPRLNQDMICLGINYMEHAVESARFINAEFNGKREDAVYFAKRIHRCTDPEAPIPAHADITSQLDYEAELAAVIGKDAKDVSAVDAASYVFGYTIINDVSAREIQNRHKQWYFGKSLDGSTPMGPYLVTADEFAFPPKLDICSRVNGELRQNSNTEKQIFKIDYVIEELSRGMTLEAGSVIATGTPSGVGMGFVPPKFLKEGDVVECEIEGIGVLRNPIGK